MTSELCGDVSSVGTPVAASAGTPVASLVEGAEFMRLGQMHRQSPLPEAWLEKLLARQTAWDETEPTETSTTLWQTLKRRAAALLAWQAEDEQKNQEALLEQVSISGDVSTPEKANNRPLLEQVSISGDVSTPEKDDTVLATAGGVSEAPAETAMHFAVGEALGCRSQDSAVSSEDDGTGCTDLLYSYLLQGPLDSADCRTQCAAALRARREPDPSWSLVEMLEEATKNCAQCRKPLRSHRVSYLYGGRRVVLSFKKEGGHVELVCRCCSHHWLLPDERSERLMTIPALDFVTMLWSGEVLPCGHDFVEGSWHVGNQVFEVREAKLVALDWMRGPALRLPLRDEDDFRRKAKLLEDACLKAIDMVEEMLEEKLKPILLQFKFCRHRQFQKQRSLSARFGRRFCEVLDMLRHRRRTLRRELREARHELVCVGAVCRMSEFFEDCFALALEADFHVGSKSSSLSSISEDDNKDDINKGRSSSVPPDCRYEWQTSAKPEEMSQCCLPCAGWKRGFCKEALATQARTETLGACAIGRPGEPWNAADKRQWQLSVTQGGPRRSYDEDVLKRLRLVHDSFEVQQYGELRYTIDSTDYRYPLVMAKVKSWDVAKPSALITGGVHGYETSGVKGALLFLETAAPKYLSHYNIVVAPCVSPWGYEFIQRWNADAEDPNRAFKVGHWVQESKALVDMVAKLGVKQWSVHMDLHETTDSDETEFMPNLAARDGKPFEPEDIPDGFYLLGDSGHPEQAAQIEFNKAIIGAVREVTHIAPPDKDGKILGKPVVDADQGGNGVIMSDKWVVGTCCNNTIAGCRAAYATTTEVYPDSPATNEDECNRAQVAAVCAALDYALEREHAHLKSCI